MTGHVVKIGKRLVGDGHPVFVIAEAGANHNRDMKTAKKLIDVAVKAGADAVKFQTYSADTLYSKKTPKPAYLNKITNDSVYDLIKKIELPREWQKELADYSKKSGIMFLSTPFDLKAVDELYRLKVPAYKIASFELTDLQLLEYAASKKRPMIVSTGMASLNEVGEAVQAIYSTGNRDVVLLHCAISYPPKFKDIHLRAMQTMKNAFHVPVGFSDHTLTNSAAFAAVALGACVIEKHFTLDRTMLGPDHPFALEPPELNALVSGIREIEESMGSPIKRMTESEAELVKLRRSIVAKIPIRKGQVITEGMLAIKRPALGLAPKFLKTVIGRKAQSDIDEDDFITWDKI